MGIPRQRIRLRRATQAQWAASNPVLLAGELAVETDTRRLKVGDGTTAWTGLDYVEASFDGSFGSIDDVDVAAAVNGSLLVYNSATGNWEGGPSVTTLEVVNGGNF